MAVAEFVRGKGGGVAGSAVTRAVGAALFALLGVVNSSDALATCATDPQSTSVTIDANCGAFEWNGSAGTVEIGPTGTVTGATGSYTSAWGGTARFNGAIVLGGSGSTMTGMSNNGLITTTGWGGLLAVQQALIASGVSNTGTIAAGNTHNAIQIGSRATLAGGINNSGLITANQESGIVAYQYGQIQNGIYNSTAGRISSNLGTAIRFTTVAQLSGGLTNYGLIRGGQTAVSVANSSIAGDIVNQGLITSSGASRRAIEIKSNSLLTGSIVNAGTIGAAGHGIELGMSARITGDISNAGLISASSTSWGNNSGVVVFSGAQLSGSIVNQSAGSIAGANYGVYGLNNATIGGTVLNYGSITGGSTGVKLENSALLAGGIVNHNFISSINVQGAAITGVTAIKGMAGSTIAAGITNSGLIAGANGIAINHQGAQTSVNNSGTIVGAMTGNLDVTNSGLWALQTWSGGTTVAGSLAFASIAGNYYQASSGTLSVGVNDRGTAGYGTASGNYSNLTVGGTATFDTNTNIYVSMNSASAVADGGTLAGVVTAASLSSSGFTIRDNSGLVNFTAATSATTLDLVAVTQVGCGATVTGSQTGPCEVAFDTPNLYVASSGSIGGAAQGVSVLPVTSGVINGRILNEGYIGATSQGVRFQSNTHLAGGLTNTGAIGAGASGVAIGNGGVLAGGFINTGSIAGGNQGINVWSSGAIAGGLFNQGTISAGGDAVRLSSNAQISGGLTNSGSISGWYGHGIGITSNSRINGGVINTGSIIGGGAAISIIGDSEVNGGITNSGYLSGQRGIKIGDLNCSSGSWCGAPGRVSGGVVNSGLIEGGIGILVEFSSVLQGGITNTGTISGSTGIWVGMGSALSGGITNSGKIAGYDGSAIGIDSGSRVNISNSGLILGAVWGNASLINGGRWNLNSNSSSGYTASNVYGDYVQAENGFLKIGVNGTNSGEYNTATIGGSANFIGGHLDVRLQQGYTITGVDTLYSVISAGNGINASGFNVTDNSVYLDFGANQVGNAVDLYAYNNYTGFGGTVTGPVSGGDIGVEEPDVYIAPSGSIATSGIAIRALDLSNSITNAGFVLGSQTAIRVETSAIMSGGIVNSGSIAGNVGINVAAGGVVSGGISNQAGGYISSINNAGQIGGSATVGIGAAHSTIGGGITNSGLIVGSVAGISLWSAQLDGGITNQGIVSGGQTAIDVSGGSVITGGIINRGTMIGTISGLSINSSFVSDGIANVGNITNIGGGSTSDVVRIINSTIQGGILNTGTIATPLTNGRHAIYVNSSELSGGVTNTGLIYSWYDALRVENSTLTGDIVNTGSMRGYTYGVVLSGAQINGAIRNSGLIESYDGNTAVGILSGSVVTNGLNNSGKIIGERTGIAIDANSVLTGGVSNTGLIAGADGAAIANDNAGNVIDIVNTISGTQVGTIVGAINGYANVSNSGLWALHAYGNAGAVVSSSFSDNYRQESSGTLRIGGTTDGASNSYSTLTVGGTADFANNANLDIRFAANTTLAGTPNLIGVVTAGTLNQTGFNITDNSALWDYSATVTGGQIDLGAYASGAPTGTISTSVTQTGLVAFDAPIMLVDTAGSITGANTGIKVLAGDVNGSITNQGYVFGDQYGVLVSQSANLSGGIYNMGTVDGMVGIAVSQGATVQGGIFSGPGSYIRTIYNAGRIGGTNVLEGINVIGAIVEIITNSGVIQGGGAGISLGSGGQVSGDLVNTGTIVAGLTGIRISTNVIGGGISNSGLISVAGGTTDAFGIRLTSASTVNGGIVNTGTIRVDQSDWAVGVVVNGSELRGSITNSGLISITSTGIYPDALGVHIDNGHLAGGIVNTGRLSVAANSIEDSASVYAIKINSSSLTGGIVNHGTIEAIAISQGTTANAHGIRLSASILAGGITNSGLIRVEATSFASSAYAYGINLSSASSLSGGIVNTGTIMVSAVGGGSSTVAIGIALRSGSNLDGGITNSGLIVARTGIGIGSGSTLSGAIQNLGTIQGDMSHYAININGGSTLTGGITNSGLLIGGGPSGGAAIGISTSAVLAGGITNLGLIAGRGSDAIQNYNSSNTIDVINTVRGSQVGTIVGAVQGYANVTNAGLWALHAYGNVGATVSSNISGNYSQEGNSTLRFGANGDGTGQYSTLTVGGSATFVDAANLDIRFASASTLSGNTLTGVVNSAGGITNAGTFNVTDNSALWDYSVSGAGSSIDLNAYLSNAPTGTISSAIIQTGLVAFDAPNMLVDSNGSITGVNTAIKVLPGDINGSIANQGYIAASVGILVGQSANIIGGINNSGTINGIVGIQVAQGATLQGGIVSAPSSYISSINNAGQIGRADVSTGIRLIGSSIGGGITNTGLIQGASVGLKIAGASRVEGSVWNLGTISGNQSWAGIVLESGSTLVGGVTNSGLISGASRGIRLISSTLEGGIHNSGSIIALTSGNGAAGLRLGSSIISGGITNSGFIGGANGIYTDNGSNISGGILNTGTMNGLVAGGIRLSSHSEVSGGLTNSGLIQGRTAISIDSNSAVYGGISNVGMIAGTNGAAIVNQNSGNTIDIINTISGGGQIGTIVGAINGYANVTNAGLWALQRMDGGSIAAGTSVASSISGNFSQLAGGTLQIGVSGSSGSGTLTGNYSSLTVGGSATFDAGSTISVMMSAEHSVLAGGTLVGVVTAGSGITSSGFSFADNSALVDFSYSTATGAFDLIAFEHSTNCGPTASSYITGPCEVAFDAPDLYIDSTGSIGGANQGIKVLAGSINGRILNEGYIGGNLTGVQFLPGSSLSGGITNAGSIVGTVGINVQGGAAVLGGIINTAGGYISSINNAGQIGHSSGSRGIWLGSSNISYGITNSGLILGGQSESLNAIHVQNSTLSGGLLNTGTITTPIEDGQHGIFIKSSGLIGGITNAGMVYAWFDAIRAENSTIGGGITNTGSIRGYTYGIALWNSRLNGSIANTGLIESYEGEVGIGLTAATLAGGIVNSGLVQGGEAIKLVEGSWVQNGILNTGTILGDSAFLMRAGSTLSGGISNHGVIQGSVAGLMVQSSQITGGIKNSGSIVGVGGASSELLVGIGLNNNSIIAGGLANSGLIQGDVVGVFAGRGSQLVGGITNSGLIQGGQFGLVVASGGRISGGITNSGSMIGASAGIAIFGAGINSSIINTGAIIGVSGAGLNMSSARMAGRVENSGIITGYSGNAITVDTDSVLSGGLSNSGLILGGIQGNVGLNNAGRWNLNSNSSSGYVASTITGDYVQGANGFLNFGANSNNSGDYNTLSVGGMANFTGGQLGVRLQQGFTLSGGDTLAGVINVTKGITSSGFTVIDNSVYLDFAVDWVGNSVNLVASANYTGFGGSGTVSGNVTQGGEIGVDEPDVYVASGGAISTSGIAIRALDLSNSITNAGVVHGTQTGIRVATSAIMSGGIVNTGSVTGLVGINIAQGGVVTGGIVGTVGSYISSINNAGQVGNSSLAVGLMLTGTSVSGGISNTGLIVGQNKGVWIATSTISGGIHNSGTVRSVGTSYALKVGDSRVVGDIVNSGLIQGQSAGIELIHSDIVGAFQNSGTILARSAGVAYFFTTLAGGINNSGIIIGQTGIDLSGSSLLSGGLTNSGTIVGDHGITVSANSTLLGTIANTGLIAGVLGEAINNRGYAIDVVNTSSGTQVGTIVGAINGNANVTNSGLWALHAYGNVGSSVTSVLRGNYAQELGGTLRIGANGDATDQYSSLSVGSAAFETAANLDVRFASSSTLTGATLTRVINAGGGISESGFNVTDNSALWDYSADVVGTRVNLVANASGAPTGNISAAVTGTGLVAFDAPNMLIMTGTGTITGANTGIRVLAGDINGGITNQGYVHGTLAGISIGPSANILGSIYNTGSIDGATGISVYQGATIKGGIYGVSNSTISSINNAGKIGSSSAYAGIQLETAAISGGISNSGEITGLGAGVLVGASSHVSGGLNNVGTITGLATVGFPPENAGIVLIGDSTLLGGLTNSGLIQGNGIGISLMGRAVLEGGLLNSGRIEGGSTALGVWEYSSIGGGITNMGTIIGNSAGIQIGRSEISGGIANSGLVAGSNTAISIWASTVNGGINNSGLVQANSWGAIGVWESLIDWIDNSGTIVSGVSGDPTEYVAGIGIYDGSVVTGDIQNSGSIHGEYGIAVRGYSFTNSSGPHFFISTVSGSIINTGTISAAYTGIYVGNGTIGGGITNSGSIVGANAGINIASGGAVLGGIVNTVGGYISAVNNAGQIGGSGLNVGVVLAGSSIGGGITNSGTILGSGSTAIAILSGSTLAGGLINQGWISQGNVYLDSSVVDFIDNLGTIVGNPSWYGINVENGSTVTAGITNSGFISGIIVNSGSSVDRIVNSGSIVGLVGVNVVSGALVLGGIVNTGLIGGTANVAIDNQNVSNTIDIINTVSGSQVGTIAGAINGYANVTNAGLWALQTMAGGTIAAGTSVASSISGNYSQLAGGTLQIGVNGSSGSGTTSGNYSSLTVGGSASFATNSGLIVSMSADHSVLAGGTLVGVVTAANGITSSGFIITDNSALVDFNYSTATGALDLIAYASTTGCNTVSGALTGPCDVAFDAPNAYIASAGSLSGGAQGIRVLSGSINGRILNEGYIGGNLTGVQFQHGASLSGGITNAGGIEGIVGIEIQGGAAVLGGIINTVGGYISAINNAGYVGAIGSGSYSGIRLAGSTITGGVTNSGTIEGGWGGAIHVKTAVLAGGITNSVLLTSAFATVTLDTNATVTGGINNLAGGTIYGQTGIIARPTAQLDTINNVGAIIATTWSGIEIAPNATVSGNINNSGYIEGAYVGIAIVGGTQGGLVSGGIVNSGTIASSRAGIEIGSNAVVGGGIVNTVGGYISSINNAGQVGGSGLWAGVALYGSSIGGGVTNSGVIYGEVHGILLQTGATLSGGIRNLAGSTISALNTAPFLGDARAIHLQSSAISGGVTNAGLVRGLSYATSGGAGVGLSMRNSTITGTIVNTGSIIGDAGWYGFGVQAIDSRIDGSVSNAGFIAGFGSTSGSAMVLGNATVTGNIFNSGFITGGKSAIYVGGSVGGALINTGTISAQQLNAISLASDAIIAGGVTNTGLVAGVSGLAITNLNTITALDIANTVSGTQVGTIVGAINGNANVTNAGLWALQRMAGGTIAAGTSVASSISGNYSQLAGGTLQIGVNGNSGSGTIAGSYSSLTVGGFANFAANTAIKVMMSADHSVMTGGTLVGVLTASGGLTSSGFVVSDNSALVDFRSVTTAGTLSLVAYAGRDPNGSITGFVTGPALVAFDAPNLVVANTGIIGSGQQGVQVLSGLIDGHIVNQGSIGGVLQGIQFGSGSRLTGGLTNSGVITGNNAIELVNATLAGGFGNSGQVIGANYGLYVDPSIITGGITNSGLLQGTSTTGLLLSASTVIGGVINQSGGTITGGVYGIHLTQSTVAGGLTNTGTITGGDFAVHLDYSTLSGGLTNAGVIQGGRTGINLNYSSLGGGIYNSGTISGVANYGITLSNSTLSGGLTNAGVILGNGGVRQNIHLINSVVIGDIVNSGSVGGSRTGISLNNNGLTGGVANSGLVSGTQSGISLVLSTVAGGISNSATNTITGGQFGLYIDPSVISGGITNSGLMQGTTQAGLFLSLSTVSGGIQNLAGGTISGGATGVKLIGSTVVGGVTNSGLISGSSLALAVDNASSLDRIVIAGNNTASFSGAVAAPNTPVTVAGGATYTLNSNFTVSGFNNAGTLVVPGSATATPVITGSFANTGTFSPTVNSVTDYAQLTVTGAATLGGALYIVTSSGGINTGSTLTGLLRASTLSGIFTSVDDGLPLVNFSPVYGATTLDLVVVPASSNAIEQALSATGNVAGMGAAKVLDALSPNPGVMQPVFTALNGMSTDQVSNAVSSTLPVLSADSPINTLAVLMSINQSIEARTLQLRGISTGQEITGNSSVWMKPFGSRTNQGNENGAYGFKANTGGLILGADTMPTTATRLGTAFAWGSSSATSNMTTSQTQTTNMYQFIGYGAHALTNTVNVSFQANGGWNSNNSSRSIAFMGTTAKAEYNSAVWHAGVGIDRPMYYGDKTTLIPSARFDYSWVRNQSYSESGASNGLGLNVGVQTYQTSVLAVDAKVIQKLSDHNSVNANVGVGYNFSPTQTFVSASYQGAAAMQFTTTGVNPNAVMGRAGVGYTYKINESVDVGIRYDIDFQNQFTNQTATAKAKWTF